MRHLLLFFITTFLSVGLMQAQEVDVASMKAMMAEKQAAADALAAEAAAIQAELDALPGWRTGGYGAIGFDGIRNNNWFAIGAPNSQQGNLNLGFGGFANLVQDGYFWDNSLGVKLARTGAFAIAGDDATKSVALTNNALDFRSLFGKTISPKLAISAELAWLSTVLERESDIKYNFALNNPGQATFSAGITWLPMDNLKVNIHPIGYQKNWPGTLASMAGAKIGASYTAQITPKINWVSNLGAFIPYTNSTKDSGVDLAYTDAAGVAQMVNKMYGTGDLMNWNWINTFTTNIWKGIGVVAELGLAGNQQLADRSRVASSVDGIIGDDNPFQSYYSVGLGYTFK